MAVRSQQRFSKDDPCPICGGYDRLPRGAGTRCFGFLSGDGRFAHCTREEFAGALERNPASQAFAHRLEGPCGCGRTHGSATMRSEGEGAGVNALSHDILAASAGYYHERLTDDARRYLIEERGLTPEVLDRFQVGWADGGLRRHLLEERGFSADACVAAGVLAQDEQRGTRDFFYQRIIFPNVVGGRVVHLSGRRIDGGKPKWMHLPGEIAYPFNVDALREPDCIWTEGILDVLSLACWNMPAVAGLGTHVKDEWGELVPRENRIIVTMDGDAAGSSGALKAAALLGKRARIASLPPGKDPNDMLREGRRAEFEECLRTAVDLLTFQINQVPTDTPRTELPLLLADVLKQMAASDAASAEAYLSVLKTRFRFTRGEVSAYRRAVKELRSAPKDSADHAASDQSGQSDQDGGGGGSQADRLVCLLVAEGVELFHDQVGDTFAVVPVGEHREIWPCRGRHLKRWLAGRLWQAEGKAAGSEALSAALNVIEAQARFDGTERELHNRVALHEGAIWYDLADRDWRAVRITARGWEIVTDPPVLFRRYSHQRPQVEPVRGGNLHDLRRFVNLRDGAQFLLCEVYLVSCFIPDFPHPIPDVHGGQGTAKTTLLRILRRLIDPSAVEVLSLPHDRTEFVQQLAHHWTPYYDNITDLSAWASDALCRASTGEGFTKRELYSDDDDVIYQFRRCPGLNGINVAARRPDLLERCLLLELDAIPKDRRRPEKQLWREFEEARPRLLGAIFDALSRAMALLDSVHLPELPRMADFAVWGCAIAEAIGYPQADFLAAYGGNQQVRNDEALQASPVAVMVLALMEDREEWKGTASQLLTELEKLTGQHGVNTQSKDWPKAANALSRELNKVRTNLAVAGIGIERGSEGTHRWVRLHKMGEETVKTVKTVTGAPSNGSGASANHAIPGPPEISSQESSHDEVAGALSAGPDDDTDANDDSPRHSAEGDLRFASMGPVSEATDCGKENGHAVTAAVPIAFDDPDPWSDEADPEPCQPCYTCHGTRFWLDTQGTWHCGTCHPPADKGLVQGWLEVGGHAEDQQPEGG